MVFPLAFNIMLMCPLEEKPKWWWTHATYRVVCVVVFCNEVFPLCREAYLLRGHAPHMVKSFVNYTAPVHIFLNEQSSS
jgi:hypothetical protein